MFHVYTTFLYSISKYKIYEAGLCYIFTFLLLQIYKLRMVMQNLWNSIYIN